VPSAPAIETAGAREIRIQSAKLESHEIPQISLRGRDVRLEAEQLSMASPAAGGIGQTTNKIFNVGSQVIDDRPGIGAQKISGTLELQGLDKVLLTGQTSPLGGNSLVGK
jgi:hypothetical protein